MRNFALFVLMMVFAGAVAGQSVVTDKMSITPWSVMDIPGGNPQLPVLSGPLSPAMGARLGLRPTRLEKEAAVLNYSRSARRFLLDHLPKGELVWVDANGIPRYKQSCGNLLAPLPVRCSGCHSMAAGGGHPVTAKKADAKKGGGGPSLWDRFWKGLGDFPWWILALIALLGLAAYGIAQILRRLSWTPAPPRPGPITPAPTPTPAPVVGPRPVIPIGPTPAPAPAVGPAPVIPIGPAPNPEPAPVAPAPTPTPNPAPAPTGEAREAEITVLNGGEVEMTVPEGTRVVGQQMPDGRFRFRLSRA